VPRSLGGSEYTIPIDHEMESGVEVKISLISKHVLTYKLGSGVLPIEIIPGGAMGLPVCLSCCVACDSVCVSVCPSTVRPSPSVLCVGSHMCYICSFCHSVRLSVLCVSVCASVPPSAPVSVCLSSRPSVCVVVIADESPDVALLKPVDLFLEKKKLKPLPLFARLRESSHGSVCQLRGVCMFVCVCVCCVCVCVCVCVLCCVCVCVWLIVCVIV